MAQNPYTTTPLNNTDAQHNMFNMREAGAAQREAQMRMMGGRQGGGNPMLGSLLGQGNTPDYSQFTYDPQARDAAQKYLGQYGLSPLAPQDVQRNAILPNSGFFGNHPRAAAMLEGGLLGAATSRDSNTWGEGISNVATSMLEAHQLRQGMLNQQFEKPFQAAQMMEGLNDLQQKRDLQESQIQEHRAQIENYRSEINRRDNPLPSKPQLHFEKTAGGGLMGYDEHDPNAGPYQMAGDGTFPTKDANAPKGSFEVQAFEDADRKQQAAGKPPLDREKFHEHFLRMGSDAQASGRIAAELRAGTKLTKEDENEYKQVSTQLIKPSAKMREQIKHDIVFAPGYIEGGGALDGPDVEKKVDEQIQKTNLPILEKLHDITLRSHTTNQQASGNPAVPSKRPTVGEVRGGYKYNGGDPSEEESWEQQ